MLLFFDLFFEKFSKKYIGFFPGIYSLRKSFSYDCILFWSDFSALTPGIHRLSRVYICVSLFGCSCPSAFAPGPVVYVVAGHPPGWRAARPIILRFSSISTRFCVPPRVFAACVSGFAGGFLRRAFDNVCVFSLSSPLKYIMDEWTFRRILFCASIRNIKRNFNPPYFFLHFSRRLPLE